MCSIIGNSKCTVAPHAGAWIETEHNPPIVRTEQAQAKSPTPGELAEAAAEKAAKEQPTQEDALFVDAAGYEQGGKA